MGSCSARLDWEHRTHTRLNGATVALFSMVGFLLLLLVTFIRMAMLNESFVTAFYWTAAYAAHREPQPEPATDALKVITLIWIALSETYWASLIGVVVTWIGAFFER